MKKYNHLLLIATIALLFGASCKKEGEQLTIKDGTMAPTLAASSNNVVLTQDKDPDTVVSFTWPAADFGKQPPVTYTLQLDLPSDTSTWANAKTFSAGNNHLSYGFTGLVLNSLLNGMSLPAGTASTIAVRIRSDVNQYNGAASTIVPVFSNTVLVQVTPYSLSLYIPGAYQNWDPSTAPLLNPVKGSPGKYEAYENITGSGLQYFKYTSAPDWNHTNYGDGGNGTFSTDGNAAGLSVPDGGYYELTANLTNNTWTATKTTWGILGDATPGGWNTDTQLTYDVTNSVWTVTAVMKQAGSFKFRANNAWSIDFGIDGSGNLQYADNPFFTYNPNLNNLTVPADGTYLITLDLHISGKYTYSLVKQ
ncbi:MAG TPA: SusE domain-containing protein [Puia sp.]|nr:SusE domain-containing protein [Puia sp.]